jgi:hypothetical protein
MNARASAGAVLLALAMLPAGCGPTLPTAIRAFGGAQQSATAMKAAAGPAKPSPIVVKPTKLNFTATPTLSLAISESGYKGKFAIVSASTKIAKPLKASVKGPSANVPVKAIAAGATTITVSDTNHQKVHVPVSVTSAVVIVN